MGGREATGNHGDRCLLFGSGMPLTYLVVAVAVPLTVNSCNSPGL